MTIGEVCEKYHITSDTLRYYEKAGLIPPVRRTNGRRDYGEDELAWVESAICMRGAGLPVEVIAEYVRLSLVGDSTFAERLELLKQQRTELEEKSRAIEAMLNRLDYKISRYEEAVKSGRLEWD